MASATLPRAPAARRARTSEERTLHIPDGFLGARVALATGAAAAGTVAFALRAERRESRAVPAGTLGALAAFVFAAQMVNVPVAPGTSGHLVGATLVALVVGPWRAIVVMAAVLVLQAGLLQDGGFTALGANLIDMGIAGALVGSAITSLAARAVGGLRGVVTGAVLGAFVATLCGAALTGLWLAASGLYPLRGVLPLLLVSHSAIGVLEAALTGAIVATLLRWRPDLLAAGGGDGGHRPLALAAGLFGVALLVAAFAAPFASALPDGLERAARDLGFATRARTWLPDAPLEALFGRVAGRAAPLVAGVVGTLAAALVAWAAGRGLSRGADARHD